MLGKYKNTLIASIGSGIEYYDFIVYALMSPYLSQIFFDHANPVHNIVYYFSVFSLGYIFRPVGGVLLGYISDKYGRKNAFLVSTFLMCISTFVIGFLPVKYLDKNTLVCMLVICRILQGISFGGELSNAITFVYESNKSKYFHGSFIFTSVGSGNILAIFVVNVLSNQLSREAIINFWWRLPFVIGGFLMLACFVFRSHLKETKESSSARFNFLDILKKISKQKHEVCLGVILSAAIASLIVVNLFFPTYFSIFYSYDVSQIFNLMMYSMAFSVIFSPLFGYFLNKESDKSKVFIFGIIVFLVIVICFAIVIGGNNIGMVFVFMSVYQVFISFFFVLSLPFMTSLFSADVRNTAVAFCYNMGYIIASIIPSVVTYFKDDYGRFFVFYIVGGIYCVLMLFIVLMFKVTKKLYYDRSKNYS
ncbi:MAG: MFS transporter [Rickettsiales bacterium]|nr:MFS transporter [Rickettsiales bacterium]